MAIDFTLSDSQQELQKNVGYDSMLAARGEGLPGAW